MKNKFAVETGILILVEVLITGYALGVIHYRGHFYAGTTIEERNVGGCTAEEAEERLASGFGNYTLTVKGTESEDEIHADDIGLHYDVTDEEGNSRVARLLSEQNAWLWPARLLTGGEPADESYALTYDREALRERVRSLACCSPETVREPQNASLTYEDGQYRITPEISGNAADEEAVYDRVCEALESGADELTLEEDLYPQAAVTAEDRDLKAAVSAANTFLAADITVTSAHHTAELNADEIRDFLLFDEDGSVELDEEKVRDWVQKNIVEPNASIGSKRTIRTPSSGKIKVSGGNYGMEVDAQAEFEQVLKELKKGKTVTRQPNCSISEVSTENAGVGTTYIDVNIERQTVYLVEENEVTYSTPCVTGTVSTGKDTPTGVYSVQWKTRNWTMKKYDVFVYYWMPIDNSTGVGLHDATWRSSFGGNIYKTNGSHGCINLPKAAAQYLYESTETGIPVIVH